MIESGLADTAIDTIFVRQLGLIDYHTANDRMREFTLSRNAQTPDEFWLLEHEPVYTQGYSCTLVPFADTSIPIVATDRGGQITYHGPGQLVIYLLIDTRRRKVGIRNFVRLIEQAIMNVLEFYEIEGNVRSDVPGVYVNSKKIASLGIRVLRGCTYHGLSLNVDMDLSPFQNIAVCGIKDLQVTMLKEHGFDGTLNEVSERCIQSLASCLGFTEFQYC